MAAVFVANTSAAATGFLLQREFIPEAVKSMTYGQALCLNEVDPVSANDCKKSSNGKPTATVGKLIWIAVAEATQSYDIVTQVLGSPR
jgi:hypothetical protein